MRGKGSQELYFLQKKSVSALHVQQERRQQQPLMMQEHRAQSEHPDDASRRPTATFPKIGSFDTLPSVDSIIKNAAAGDTVHDPKQVHKRSRRYSTASVLWLDEFSDAASSDEYDSEGEDETDSELESCYTGSWLSSSCSSIISLSSDPSLEPNQSFRKM